MLKYEPYLTEEVGVDVFRWVLSEGGMIIVTKRHHLWKKKHCAHWSTNGYELNVV